jgi:hypothetical protein
LRNLFAMCTTRRCTSYLFGRSCTHTHTALSCCCCCPGLYDNAIRCNISKEFGLLHRNEYDLHKYFDIVRHKFLVKNQQRTKTRKREAGRLTADSLAIPCLSRYKFFQPGYSNRSIPFCVYVCWPIIQIFLFLSAPDEQEK